MKHKLQTLLKHKLQWLLLLAALLGVSQDVWGATRTFASGDKIYLTNQSFGGTTWVSNDAWIHMWGGDAGDKDYKFTCVSGTAGEVGAIYAAEITTGGTYVNYIVTRNNSGSSGPWNNKWNQTGDCTLPSSGNRITNIQENCASITWNTYTPCTTVGGTAKVNGSTTTNISRGASVTLSLTGQTSGSTVVWQKSTDGGSSWSNVGSITDTPTQNTQYRAKVTKGCDAYSSVATVKMPTTIYVDVSAVSWTNVRIYYWNGGSAWTGDVMTAVPGNTGWYTFDIPYDKDLEGYIINNNGNGSNQTVSITPTLGAQNCIKVNTTTSDSKRTVSNADCPSSTCTTPTISEVTPSSAQTKSLSTNSATPSAVQAVTATYSGGNQKGWTVTPSTISGYPAATFDNAASASTNLNMKYEGEYTATFGAGCGNTTDATLATAKITVNPSEIYIAGPLLNGGEDWATNTLMTKGSTSFYYDWDAARTTGEFTLRTSNSASEAAYIIPNYAKNNYTGISSATGGNHNLSVDGVSFAVGDKVRVTAKYKGWNSSEDKPEYDITFTKRCSYPTAGSLTAPSNVCSGENFTITLSGHTATSTTISWRKRVYNGSAYGSWTVIEGETGTSLTISQTAQTQYKARVTTESGSCYKEATAVTVKMYKNSSVSSVDLSSNNVCIGQSGITASATKTLGKGNGAWSSSNTTVATVTSGGAITAKAAGSADIIYTITGGCNGTVSDNATLTVNPNMSVAGVSVSLDSDDVCLGATPTASKSGSVVLSGGTAQFISSDPTVATVNATTGAISTLKAGTTDITYRVSGGCGSTVETLPAELTVKAKPTLTITPAGTIYNYMPMTVSSDMDVATWSWTGSADLIDGYFTSELTRTATFKGKIKNQETTRAVTFTG